MLVTLELRKRVERINGSGGNKKRSGATHSMPRAECGPGSGIPCALDVGDEEESPRVGGSFCLVARP